MDEAAVERVNGDTLGRADAFSADGEHVLGAEATQDLPGRPGMETIHHKAEDGEAGVMSVRGLGSVLTLTRRYKFQQKISISLMRRHWDGPSNYIFTAA